MEVFLKSGVYQKLSKVAKSLYWKPNQYTFSKINTTSHGGMFFSLRKLCFVKYIHICALS